MPLNYLLPIQLAIKQQQLRIEGLLWAWFHSAGNTMVDKTVEVVDLMEITTQRLAHKGF